MFFWTNKNQDNGKNSKNYRPASIENMTTSNTTSVNGTGHTAQNSLPFSYARTLSWLSLLFILLTSLGLSIFISNSARDTLLTRQEEFARLLVQNINSQIFRRFAMPLIISHGKISLNDQRQQQDLDTVVKSVTFGLPVEKVRIFTFSRHVVYSTRKEEIGKLGLAPQTIDETLAGGFPKTEIIAAIPEWQAPFRIPLQPGTFVLRILYPMRGEYIDASSRKIVEPHMGALEITYDITGVYEQVLTFQGIIVVLCLLSSVILFGLLLMTIYRAERILADRMQKNSQLENELHSNEKLASMGRVVASIAHEIRNPLGIIRSTAELLLNRTAKADKATSRLLGAIYDESVRLSQTVNDFLDYARPRRPRQDMVEIRPLLDQVTGFLESEFLRHGVTIQTDFAITAFVAGDKDLLYRAFYNILVNGQQAIEGQGTITIDGRMGSSGDCSCETGNSTSPNYTSTNIVLEFIDSGPGFANDNLLNLLDPFFTTKEGGTGLGLPIVKSIIDSHGGSIELENSKNRGALVRVILPALNSSSGDNSNAHEQKKI